MESVSETSAPRPVAPRGRQFVSGMLLYAVPSALLAISPSMLLFSVWGMPGSPMSWQPLAAPCAIAIAWSKRGAFRDLETQLALRFPDAGRPERSSSPLWVAVAVAGIAAATVGRMPSLAYAALIGLAVALIASLKGPFVARLALPCLVVALLGTPVPPSLLRPATDLARTASAVSVSALLEIAGDRVQRSESTLVFAASDRTITFRQGLSGVHPISGACASAIVFGFIGGSSRTRRFALAVCAPLVAWVVHVGVLASLCHVASRGASLGPERAHADWVATGATIVLLWAAASRRLPGRPVANPPSESSP